MRRDGTGPLRARTDGILVAVEEDLPVRVLPLELGDAGEDVLEGGRFVIRVDPYVHGLLGVVVSTTRIDHRAPREPEAAGGL